jgi:transposase
VGTTDARTRDVIKRARRRPTFACKSDRIGHLEPQVTTDEATEQCDDGEPSSHIAAGERKMDPLEKARALLALVSADETITKELVALIAGLVASNAALQRLLSERNGRRFKSSEVVSSAQLRLLLSALDAAQTEPADARAQADAQLRETAGLDEMLADDEEEKKRKRKKPRKRPERRPFPESLRRIEKKIEVPVAQRACPCCKAERKTIGYDVTETLDMLPAEMVVYQEMREKLACTNCEKELCRAPLPDRVIARGRLGVQLVACIVVDKYWDGLPLHRQLRRFTRLGVSLPLSTLVDQVAHVGKVGAPLQKAAMLEVLASGVMHLDGTGMPVLDKAHRDGTRYGTLWGAIGDRHVGLYLYMSTGKKTAQREGEIGPEELLGLRKGPVVADASNLFDKSFERDDLIEYGCNAHSRRYFVKALDGGDSRASLPIGTYRRLYKLEREAQDLTVEERTKFRHKHSRPIFDALLQWCQAHVLHEPPSSPLGKALQYFINHHVALGRYIDNGAVPIDNTLVERQHIRVALSKKNFLFVGSDAGGERAAVVYTILACCELNRVDPVKYLADVLPLLARGVTEEEARDLLPHRWKAARAWPVS